MNIIQIIKKFPTQESCIKHLEQVRWDNKPICPYCTSINTNPLVKELRHHCNGCRKSFRVTVGTIFHHTAVPLQKWFLLISLMLNAKKGLSACQAARDIELRRPTVWCMMHRIRNGMKDNADLLSGIVEMDETYVGGKPRKENKKDDDGNDKPSNPRGRGTKKTPVVGMVEREGEVRTQVASKYELKAKDLRKIVHNNINIRNALLVTDEYMGYNNMNATIPHLSVNHSYEYVNGDIHTNTIESFWAILKRGITGQFHWVSKKYLQNYLYEFEFKYNNRINKGNVTFESLLGKMCYVRS